MSSFRFFHAADLHLDSPLRGLARRGEVAGAFLDASRRALENLVSAAIAENVAFLLIAGDIYDGDWRDYATGHFFVRQMGRLARAGIPTYLISGNHDAESVITRALPLPANVHSFSTRAVATQTIEPLRVALHGWGFANKRVPDNVVQRFPPAVSGYFNIGLLHTSLTGREGHAAYAPCSVEDLRRLGYDYWALGHVHTREIVDQDPYIVFPGNLQGRHARETGPKGASLVTVVDGRVAQIEAVALDAARFEHLAIDLAGESDPAAPATHARTAMRAAHEAAGGRPLALRLSFHGVTPLHDHLLAGAERIGEEMQALAWEIGTDVLVEKVKVATTPPPQAHGIAALAGLDEVLAAVAADPDVQADIAATLARLKGRVPPEALDPGGMPDTADAIAAALSALRAALGDVAASREVPPGTSGPEGGR